MVHKLPEHKPMGYNGGPIAGKALQKKRPRRFGRSERRVSASNGICPTNIFQWKLSMCKKLKIWDCDYPFYMYIARVNHGRRYFRTVSGCIIKSSEHYFPCTLNQMNLFTNSHNLLRYTSTGLEYLNSENLQMLGKAPTWRLSSDDLDHGTDSS